MKTQHTDESTKVDVAGPSQDVAGPTPSTPEQPAVAREGAAGPDEQNDESITPPHGDTLGSLI